MLNVGDVVRGQFELRQKFGGGMATVFRAWDLVYNREVALKVIAPDYVDRKRFADEARVLMNLGRVRVWAWEAPADQPGLPEADAVGFIAMELVDGRTLIQVVDAKGALPEPEAVALITKVAQELAYVHDAGIVHRDLKPANVIVTGDSVRLVDFGIAMLPKPVSLKETMAGGTVGWAAPEQLTGARDLIDPRTDLYALGEVFYYLLHGTPPFPKERQLVDAVRRREPPKVTAEVDDATRALLEELVAMRPEERPPSATEVVVRLVAIAARIGEPGQVEKRRRARLPTAAPKTSAPSSRAWVVPLALIFALVALVAWDVSSARARHRFMHPPAAAATAMRTDLHQDGLSPSDTQLADVHALACEAGWPPSCAPSWKGMGMDRIHDAARVLTPRALDGDPLALMVLAWSIGQEAPDRWKPSDDPDLATARQLLDRACEGLPDACIERRQAP